MRIRLQTADSREDGYTLIEMLVAMAMATLVTGAAVMLLLTIMHRQPKTTSTADVIGNARNALEKITQDVRVGKTATVAQPSELKVKAECSQVGSTGTGECEVAYSCLQESGKLTYKCQRSVSGGAATTVISGLASAQVFCVYPTSEAGKECGPQGSETVLYAGIKVELPNYEESHGNMVLEDGAALHNSPQLLGG
jgi:prepilin-type N-terminal cleavage/methylation domain-containing protein